MNVCVYSRSEGLFRRFTEFSEESWGSTSVNFEIFMNSWGSPKDGA